jgi:coenzyme Q-binding protein COQ10
MPKYSERRVLPYSQQQLFDLVADVRRYPEFLPWCLSCDVLPESNTEVIYADLVIGYKMVREKFRSRVTLNRSQEIHVEYLSGPMRYLSNDWKFIKDGQDSCIIDFKIDFEFRNAILKSLMGVFFHEIVRRMVAAFEQRAKDLYA